MEKSQLLSALSGFGRLLLRARVQSHERRSGTFANRWAIATALEIERG